MPIITQPNRHPKKKQLNIKEFQEIKNKLLIIRNVGGLGDILMHRMLFEDFKKLCPEIEIHFACPKYYHSAVEDHPFVDKILTIEEIDRRKYLMSYNTSTICGRYEMKYAPFCDKHRSDIWAEHCGLTLTEHNMHIHLSEVEKIEGKYILEKKRDRPGKIVILSPISAMLNKNLTEEQIMGLVYNLRQKGYCVIGLHNTVIPCMLANDIPTIFDINLRQWLAVIHESDYVISVDTATFHAAGGMKKPLVGIFTFVDGITYGKYFDFFLVQKHRNLDTNWECGPCYEWGKCVKTLNTPKPCVTNITVEMILEKTEEMFKRW
jgi:ADP-heptose:LPS heptosyltransferase